MYLALPSLPYGTQHVALPCGMAIYLNFRKKHDIHFY